MRLCDGHLLPHFFACRNKVSPGVSERDLPDSLSKAGEKEPGKGQSKCLRFWSFQPIA